ncbi:MAG: hypothetical protein KA369_18070 [Spirochaetes bacterium]|nr:hypothetical protein [Spirochaetota bacterium]
MQFVFLLLFNVFLGAVLYLVISLKLERSATEFRERRFRKEMDEIIKEFNVTAERNISLLENRIRALRLLLEKSGDIRSLDVTLDEAGIDGDGAGSPGAVPAGHVLENSPDAPDRPHRAMPRGEGGGGELIKKGLLLMFDKIINRLPVKKNALYEMDDAGADMEMPGDFERAETAPVSSFAPERNGAIIEKDLTRAMEAVRTPARERRPSLTEEEIVEIVASSDDRYKLVSLLFEGGCAVEDISRYSGIPAGEVRLVLNLNSSRESTGM